MPPPRGASATLTAIAPALQNRPAGSGLFGQAAGEEAAVGLGVSQLERALVGGAGLGAAAEPAQEVGPGRVEVRVGVQLDPSIASRPASGPSVSATATARFSATTGEPVRRASSP